MKKATWVALLLALTAGSAAGTREWTSSPMAVPAWGDQTDLYLGCSSGEILGYGTGSTWAEEIQVCFKLPAPPLAGPWLIEYVAFFVSGTESHSVVVREGSGMGTAPGAVINDEMSFTPIYATWPPAGWTYVSLRGEATCPDYLTGSEGDCFVIGTDLLSSDSIGLGPVETNIEGWGFYDGAWINDTVTLQLTPAVRIGLSDLGLSPATRSTWGAIKQLFGPGRR